MLLDVCDGGGGGGGSDADCYICSLGHKCCNAHLLIYIIYLDGICYQ